MCLLAVKAHHLCLDALLRQGNAVPRAGLKCDSGSNSCQTAASAAPAAQAGQQQAAACQHGQLPFTAEAWQVSQQQQHCCRSSKLSWRTSACRAEVDHCPPLILQASRQRLLQETQLLLQRHKEQQQQQQRMLLLVDDINHYRSMRYEFVQLARTCELLGCVRALHSRAEQQQPHPCAVVLADGAAFLQIFIECPVVRAAAASWRKDRSCVCSTLQQRAEHQPYPSSLACTPRGLASTSLSQLFDHCAQQS